MKNLNERRDELANDKGNYYNNPQRLNEVQCFKDGFDTAVDELMPEIEKLVEALEFYAAGPHNFQDEMKDDYRYGGKRARQALTKFKEFMGDNNG